jgi:hypothetical protein
MEKLKQQAEDEIARLYYSRAVVPDLHGQDQPK